MQISILNYNQAVNNQAVHMAPPFHSHKTKQLIGQELWDMLYLTLKYQKNSDAVNIKKNLE